MNLGPKPEFNAVISDATCLIILQKIDAFEVLHTLYPRVITTPDVLREFGEDLPSWITIQPVRDNMLVDLFKESVDPGEASAIALAMELTNCLMILDDRQARNLAKKMRLDFIGTLGLFIEAKTQGLIDEVKPYFEKIQQTNFRLRRTLLIMRLNRLENSKSKSLNDSNPKS